MKYRIISLVLILILFSSNLVNAISIKSMKISGDIENISKILSDGDILYVGGDGPNNYTKIQQAINNAYNSDTIFVYNGTYFEVITINKTINLIGENKYETIIDAREEGNVIYVYNDWVNISGFTIKNSSYSEFHLSGVRIYSNHTTIENNILIDNIIGIQCYNIEFPNTKIRYNNYINNNIIINSAISIIIRYSDNIICQNNFIKNNITYMFGGIVLQDSKNCIISNNKIIDVTYITNYGIGLFSSKSNEISHNEIRNNTVEGINLFKSDYNNIYDNNITNVVNHGIFLTKSKNNKIHYNSISDIDNKGIYLKQCFKNLIHHNKIIKSQEGIYIIQNSRFNDIFYNEIKNISKKGVYIERSRFNKIHHNNIIDCRIKSLLWFSYFNFFHRNYWNRPRILPKRIFGISNILIGRQDLFPRFFPNEI